LEEIEKDVQGIIGITIFIDMKKSNLKQLVRAVMKEVSNPEAWRKHEFPSGEPPEPMDAEETPDDESLEVRIHDTEASLAHLEKEQLKHELGSPEWNKYSGQIRGLLQKLINLQVESERGSLKEGEATNPDDLNTRDYLFTIDVTPRNLQFLQKLRELVKKSNSRVRLKFRGRGPRKPHVGHEYSHDRLRQDLPTKFAEKLAVYVTDRELSSGPPADFMAEDHGLGFSHNVSVPQDTNTMNKSTIEK